MENEKLFELMSKMYGEMQEGFKNVNNRMDKLEKNQVALENETHNGFKTLYDEYIQNSEAITRMEARLEYIADKVSKNEMEVNCLQFQLKNKYRG